MMRKLLAALALLLLAGTAQAQSPGALGGATILTTLNPADYVCDIISASGGPTNQCATVGLFATGGWAGVNAQTGTSYTIAASDAGKLLTFSNAGAIAVTLPAATTAGFGLGKVFYVTNNNTGAVTITPTTSTIGGGSSLVLYQYRSAIIVSDGANYQLTGGSSSFAQGASTVAEGGTGLATGTSGGVPYFASISTMASSALLTNHGVLVGGGAGAGPAAIAVGATGTILAGTSAANPAFTATPSGLTSLGVTTLNATAVNAGADAVAGTVAIFPTTTATGKTTLTATSNSGATTTNINTAAQAGARTYTVPDQGGSATFQLTGGTQSTTTGLIPTPLRMIDMRTAAGLLMTASASGTNFGLTYTPGTTAILIGTATSSSTTGDTAAIDIVLPPNYIAGTNITLTAGCYYTNTSSAASVHTMAAAAYLNTAAGLQGSTLIATGAQTCPITTSALQTFTITGTTLAPGSLLTLTFTAAVTNGAGISTEWLTAANIN